jgi:hypothetical protein
MFLRLLRFDGHALGYCLNSKSRSRASRCQFRGTSRQSLPYENAAANKISDPAGNPELGPETVFGNLSHIARWASAEFWQVSTCTPRL